MAHYLTNNEKFHIFSKSPVLSSMAVSQAVNKSGHTVSTNDVWADDVPWFTEVADEAGAITRAADARYNDLILWGSDIYVRKGDKTNGASTGTTFAELWEKHTDLTEARAYALGSVTTQTPTNIVTKTVEIKNASDKVVLKYHVGKQIDLLTTANNANVASTWAARMFIDGKVVDQFVSPTDKVFAGNPSTGYTTLVYTATAAGNKYGFVAEGEADADFVNNAFAGIVQFNQSRNSGHKFAASVFEYVGDKLDATVAALSKAVFGAGTPGEEDQPTSLTEQVLANTQAITKLNGAANIDGSVLHTVETAINALDNASDQQGSAGISVVQTNGVVAATVTTAIVTEGVIDETTAGNVVTASDAKAIADKAASDAITTALADTEGSAITEKIETEIANATLADGQTIAETTATDKLVTVEDVKTYVENNAKVSIAGGNGISVTPAGKATEFTVSVDTAVVATQTDVSTAKSELQGEIDKINTSLTTGTIHTEIDGVRQIANAAKNTADTAVQSVSRATGSSELITVTDGTDVTISLSTEVATKSDITTEIGKLTTEGGSVKTLQTKVAEIETSLATGATANAIKAAQNAADAAQTTANQGVSDAAAALAEAQAKVASVTVIDGTGTITSGGTTTAPEFTVAAGTIEEGKLVTGTTVKAHVAAEIAKVNGAADTLAARVTTAEGKIKTLEETTVPAIQQSITDLKAVSLAKSSADGLVKVSTTGTVGTGIESISVEVSDTVAKTTDTLSATSTGSNNVEVVLSGTIAQPTLTVTGTDIASAQELATLTQTVNTHIAEAAGLYLSVEKVEALPEGDDRKTNKIYLLPLDTEAGREQNIHTEYIWTGTSWEIIGTTAIDISSLEKAADDAQKAADAAQNAADAAQGEVDALEGVVAELTTTVGTNKTAAETGISEAKAAAKAAQDAADKAQGEVDELEQVVSALSQTHASDKTALEASIKAVSDKVGTDSVESQIASAIDAIGTGVAQSEAGISITQTKGVVELSVTPGSVAENNASIVTGGAVYAAIKEVSDLVGTTAVATQITTAIEALDSDASGNGITVALTDGKVTSVSAAEGTVAEGNTNVVTGGVVHTAVEAVKAIAEAKISAVQNDSTHFGSPLVATSGTTVTVSPAKEWSVGETKPASTITSVINGKMSDGKTIDDANLVDGTSMFAGNTSLTTYVGSLGKLTNGKNMFKGCTGLTTFVADLASLTDGTDMFAGCALTEESLMYIVDSLPVASKKTITVEVAASVTNKADYADEALKKGWTLA